MKLQTHLPKDIRTLLQERFNHHLRFFVLLLILTIAALSFIGFMASIVDFGQALEVVSIALFTVFPILSGYFMAKHRKEANAIKTCLKSNHISVIRGRLKHIVPKGKKRASYIIDDKTITGKIAFPGFTAFQDSRIIDIISFSKEPEIMLYLLPNNLIAGVAYPTHKVDWRQVPMEKNDWKALQRGLFVPVKIMVGIALFISLIMLVATLSANNAPPEEHELWLSLKVINGVFFFIFLLLVFLKWPLICALLQRNHPSVHKVIISGMPSEWYLTRTVTKSRSGTSSQFSGWVRLGNTLHLIQNNLNANDSQLFRNSRHHVHVAYVMHKGRRAGQILR